MAMLDRLYARSERVGSCIVWTGRLDRYGYGRIKVDGKDVRVSRAAWIARHGTPPSDKPYVLHRCDNPACFRDEHLFVGTQADNLADMRTKGRGRTNGLDRRERCVNGHVYTEATTARHPKTNARICRVCRRESQQRHRARESQG